MIRQRGTYEVNFNGTGGTVIPLSSRSKIKEPVEFQYGGEVPEILPRYIQDFLYSMRRYMGVCYLLHFERPYEHAQHYLGFTKNVPLRELRHRAGRGARLIEVITEAGIDFQLVRVWPGVDRYFERKLKRSGHGPRYCPLCNPESAHKRSGAFSYIMPEVEVFSAAV